MKDFDRYLELIVEPTVEDFSKSPTSVRHAFLACVVIYHASDRAPSSKSLGNLLNDWRKKWPEFALIETMALHFKHVKSDAEKRPLPPDTLRISHALGFDDVDDKMDLRNLFFVVRDAVRFLHEQARSGIKRTAPPAAKSPHRQAQE